MKFCPNCGNQLPDEAKFCPKCGAKQPDIGPVTSEPTPQPVNTQPYQTQQPNNPNPNPVMDEGADCRYLLENDQKFKTMMKATTMARLSTLANLLAVITFILFMAVNFAALTGQNVSSSGSYYVAAYTGGVLPFGINRYQASALYNYTSQMGNAFCPNSGLGSSISSIVIVFSIAAPFYGAAIILGSLLNALRKGYRYREYKKDGGINIYKNTSPKKLPWILGVMINVAFIGISIIQYFAIKDLKYDYSDGKMFYLGEMTADPSCMVACIISGILTSAAIVVVTTILHVKARKMMKPYYENN